MSTANIDPESFARMEANVARLTAAMLGDRDMGTKGLVGQFGELRTQVEEHEARLGTIEGERTVEIDDREWVKGVRLNWSSPARLVLGLLGLAFTAALGAIVSKWLG